MTHACGVPGARTVLTVNGRDWRWPVEPVVVICLDGCTRTDLESAIAEGAMPWLSSLFAGKGTVLDAEAVMPTFTNPNNVSIVTGVPPSLHGIVGNCILDPNTREPVLMNDASWLRAPTLLEAFSKAGARTVAVTAKDKLRALIGHRMQGPCFSAERAHEAVWHSHGIENVLDRVGLARPEVYSQALTEFVLHAGAVLLEQDRPDLMYLSTSDYVQHKHGPGSHGSLNFYAMVDRHLAWLDRLGARIVVTADHGMNAKHDAWMRPSVLWLQDLLDASLGPGIAQVILPITDPYVVHHGALGSCAGVHLPPDLSEQAQAFLASQPGVTAAMGRDEAAARLELPMDRTADLVIVMDQDHVAGSSRTRHDLSGLDHPLRSHGGWAEQRVPLLCNRVLTLPPSRRWRNFDAFDLALNRD